MANRLNELKRLQSQCEIDLQRLADLFHDACEKKTVIDKQIARLSANQGKKIGNNHLQVVKMAYSFEEKLVLQNLAPTSPDRLKLLKLN